MKIFFYLKALDYNVNLYCQSIRLIVLPEAALICMMLCINIR